MPAPKSADLDDQYGLLVHSFAKNKRSEIRISINEYMGRNYIDIREFYLKDEDTFAPGKSGVTISPELIGELIQGVALLADALGFDPDSLDDPQADTLSSAK